jgi:hypothetical protein
MFFKKNLLFCVKTSLEKGERSTVLYERNRNKKYGLINMDKRSVYVLYLPIAVLNLEDVQQKRG